MLDIIVLNQLQEQLQLAKLLSNWLHSPEGKRRADKLEKSAQELSALKLALAMENP